MGWLQGPIGDDTFDLEVPVADPAHLPSQFVRSYSIPGGRAIESPLRPVLRLGCSGA
jgi:hypothetical protein